MEGNRENYDVAVGCTSGVRYITADPIGLAVGANLYAYVENNPLNYIDPYGLLTFGWHGNWGGPGRVNGQTRKSPTHPNRKKTGWRESDNFPREGDEGFVPPVDPRDRAYYDHDTCINDCENNNNERCNDASSTSDCIAKCDIKLSNNPNIPGLEQDFFRWYSRFR